MAVHLLATHCKLSNSFRENLLIHDHTMLLSYITAIQPIVEIVKMGYFHTQTLFVLWVVYRNNFNVFTLWIYWYFIFFLHISIFFRISCGKRLSSLFEGVRCTFFLQPLSKQTYHVIYGDINKLAPAVKSFVEETAKVTQPDNIHVCDGSEKENILLLYLLQRDNVVTKLHKYENW